MARTPSTKIETFIRKTHPQALKFCKNSFRFYGVGFPQGSRAIVLLGLPKGPPLEVAERLLGGFRVFRDVASKAILPELLVGVGIWGWRVVGLVSGV